MISEQNKNKKLFFLVAMPRSGNTMFASIMNQNKDLVVTANSITLEIMKDLFLLKQTDVFQNYQDHKSLDNVLDSVYDTFYKDWKQKIIIDRGPVMTTGNFELMQKHGVPLLIHAETNDKNIDILIILCIFTPL